MPSMSLTEKGEELVCICHLSLFLPNFPLPSTNPIPDLYSEHISIYLIEHNNSCFKVL